MNITVDTNNFAVRELSMEEVDQVSGGVIPLVVAAFYMTGFSAGVGAGWAFGNRVWS